MQLGSRIATIFGILFWLLFFGLPFFFVWLMDQSVHAGQAVNTGIKYRPELGQGSPVLDIYSVQRSQTRPVIIYIHGGAWQRGSRSQVGVVPGYFNRAGYVFVSIDYRLVPDVEMEDQLADVDRALGWVSENIARYGGDPENLHLMGHSAGAHLVSMTGVRPGKHTKQLIEKGALRTVISNDTMAYDVPGIAARRGGRLFRMQQRPFGKNRNRWWQLSPIRYIVRRSPNPDFMLLSSGAGPAQFRQNQTKEFAQRLRDASVSVKMFAGSQYIHRQINVEIGYENDVTKAISEFLEEHSR